jgi:phosphatidylglycerol:prolipoprotein diacylglycerol transferase
MVVLGGALAFAVIFLLRFTLKRVRPERVDEYEDCIYAFLFAMAFAVIGAALFKPIINSLYMLTHIGAYSGLPFKAILSLIFGEIVFYGGFLGGFLGLLWYCRRYKISFLATADIGAPGLAIGHAVGRVGCLLGGCCYGEEVSASNPFAVFYPDYPAGYPINVVAPSHVPLLAVPLMETIFLAILSLVLSVVFLRSRKRGLTASIYLIAYGVWRFTIEFWRGDAIRGTYGIFTTSQYVSLLLIVCGLAIIIRSAMRADEPV